MKLEPDIREHSELGTIEPSCESGYCDAAATVDPETGEFLCPFHLNFIHRTEPVAGWPS